MKKKCDVKEDEIKLFSDDDCDDAKSNGPTRDSFVLFFFFYCISAIKAMQHFITSS